MPDTPSDAAIEQVVAAHTPAQLAVEVLRLRARCTELQDDRDGALESLNNWFDQRRLDEAELTPLFLGAARGYLRTCRSGGMPRQVSDQAEACFREFARLYLVPALEPVLRKLREAAAASPADATLAADRSAASG